MIRLCTMQSASHSTTSGEAYQQQQHRLAAALCHQDQDRQLAAVTVAAAAAGASVVSSGVIPNCLEQSAPTRISPFAPAVAWWHAAVLQQQLPEHQRVLIADPLSTATCASGALCAVRMAACPTST